MAKKGTAKTASHQTKIITIMGATAILVLGILLRVLWQLQAHSAKRADMYSLGTMIVDAARGLKRDAPVEAKTGDVYFPEAKLYLPADPSSPSLIYSYNAEAEELSVSDEAVFNRNKVKVINTAEDMEGMFEAVPKLQACQRGVVFAYDKTDRNPDELKQTVQLNNGKELFLYVEKNCPELNSTAALLKNVRAY